MKTFKNTNWKKRDYECTNVVACIAEKAPAAHWVECDAAYITPTMMQLWIENDVRYFGWL